MQIYRGNDNIDFAGVILEIVDGVVDECDGLLDSVVRLPVSSDQEFVSGEELAGYESPHCDDILMIICADLKQSQSYIINPKLYSFPVNALLQILQGPSNMTNRNAQVPRSIKFHENSIRNFVESSSFLNSTSKPSPNNFEPQSISNHFTEPLPQSTKTGFSFYNKNNLLLRACNSEDIQYVQKNPVIYQEDIIVAPPSTRNKQNKQTNGLERAKTASNFYQPSPVATSEEKMSKEAELNQFLFNYRKQEQDKKNKKLKFLADMEQKLTNLEKEATQLESQKQLQYEQINGILKIHSSATQNAKKAELVGKINSALHMSEANQTQIPTPKKLTEEMELLQLNLAIETNHDTNDALLQQVERLSRSRSKQRRLQISKANNSLMKAGKKMDDNFQPSVLSKTLKRPMQAPPRPSSGSKKLTATWRGK